MRKVTWRRFDQSAKQLVVGQTTIGRFYRPASITKVPQSSGPRSAGPQKVWITGAAELQPTVLLWLRVFHLTWPKNSSTPRLRMHGHDPKRMAFATNRPGIYRRCGGERADSVDVHRQRRARTHIARVQLPTATLKHKSTLKNNNTNIQKHE